MRLPTPRALVPLLGLLGALALAGPALAASWSIVQADSHVEVDATYLGGTVTMRFDRLDGRILFDPQAVSDTTARISVPSAQVDTGLGIANAFIRGRDWLNTDRHPSIDFNLTRLVRTSDQTAEITGDMTLLGVTRPISFSGRVFRFGPAQAADGAFQAGFDLTGRVDRRAFGHTTGLPEVSAIFPVRIRLVIEEDR